MSKKPEIIVFAGPNGSGKSTITSLAKIIEPYINADDIKRTTLCTDMEAAITANELRMKQCFLLKEICSCLKEQRKKAISYAVVPKNKVCKWKQPIKTNQY